MSATVHLVAVDAHAGGSLTACGSSDEPALVVSDRSLCDCRRCLTAATQDAESDAWDALRDNDLS